MTILLLPFAVIQQDEATAKLCRQIPRFLGAEMEQALSGRGVAVRYLSSRGATESGKAGLVAALKLPESAELEATGRMYSADVICAGKFGVSERNLVLDARLYDTHTNSMVYSKHFETYPTYYFDSVEEIKIRITQVLGLELEKEEQVALMRRPTESWEALLCHLLAEDDRYALSLGLELAHPLEPIGLFRQALTIDPEFGLAQSGLEHYLVMLLERGITISGVLPELRSVVSETFYNEIQEFV